MTMIDQARASAAGGLVTLQPEGWPAPKGYAYGMMGRGQVIFVGGQIGWDAESRFADGMVGQIAQALRNILAVLAAAGAGPQHIARLTWYVTDMELSCDSIRAGSCVNCRRGSSHSSAGIVRWKRP